MSPAIFLFLAAVAAQGDTGSFVIHTFRFANGEMLPELREQLNNPGYLEKLEQVIMRMPDAQARLARFPGPARDKAGTAKGPRRVA